MKTMKKFWKYFINFVVLFLIVSALMYLGTINKNKKEQKIENVQTNAKIASVETNV